MIITIQSLIIFQTHLNLDRRGMGLSCTVRGLQWNHILAEDVLFWLYDIKNISDKDIEKNGIWIHCWDHHGWRWR